MKDNIANVLEDFEKLAYKILMWVILVPKTVIKVVVDPGFVKGYVRQELASEKGKQFDEYISPILLYLGVMLLPAIAIYLLPSFGMKVFSPYEDPSLYYDAYVETDQGFFSINDPALSTVAPVEGAEQQAPNENRKIIGHEISLRAELRTRGDTNNQFHTFVWKIWSCASRDPDSGKCNDFYYGEWHDEQYGTACINGSGVFTGADIGCLESEDTEPGDQDWTPQYTITFPEIDINGKRNNRNLVSDTFSWFYLSSILDSGDYAQGEYVIEIYASTRSLDDPPWLVESDFESLSLLTYPNSAEFSINPFSGYSTIPGFLGTDEPSSIIDYLLSLIIRRDTEGEVESRTLADRLESGETIAFGLALLLPPLLIAGAIGLFMGVKPSGGGDGDAKPKSSIGEEALRENFYAQCYYFAPVGMAFWAWYYSSNYYTYDIQYRGEWLWIPLALALLWFVVVEIYSIADYLPSKSKVRAFFILFGCLTSMFLIIGLGQAFAYNYDWLRKSAIWSYPGIAFLLTLGVIYRQFFRKRKGRKGVEKGVEMNRHD